MIHLVTGRHARRVNRVICRLGIVLKGYEANGEG